MATRNIFYGKQVSATQYEALMGVFSRTSSHADSLSQVISAYLRLGELSQERKKRSHNDTTRIVDLGSGPGVFLGSILKRAGLVREVSASAIRTVPSPPSDADNKSGEMTMPEKSKLSVWCVDPFYYNSADRVEVQSGSDEWKTLPTDVNDRRLQVIGEGRVKFVSADAVEFLKECRERVGFVDRILIKEAVHHVHDLEALCQGFRHVLRPGIGLAVIAGRTPSNEVPWFPQAAKLFKESCMDAGRICELVRRVPGLRVSTSEKSFDVHINLAGWCTLLRGRFWSNLATISDDEMEQGISEVRKRYNEDDAAPVVFPDHFTFIHVFCDENADAENTLE